MRRKRMVACDFEHFAALVAIALNSTLFFSTSSFKTVNEKLAFTMHQHSTNPFNIKEKCRQLQQCNAWNGHWQNYNFCSSKSNIFRKLLKYIPDHFSKESQLQALNDSIFVIISHVSMHRMAGHFLFGDACVRCQWWR